MNDLVKEGAGSLYDQIAEGMSKVGGSQERLKAISVRPFYSKASDSMVKMKRTYFPIDPVLLGHDWETAERLDDGYNARYWAFGNNGIEYDREQRQLN